MPANFGYMGPAPHIASVITRLYDHKGKLGCDVETVSLIDRRPLGVSFAINAKEGFYFPINSPLLPWHFLKDPNVMIVFHNYGFDIPVLEKYMARWVGGGTVTNVVDSCIAAKLLGLPARLSDLCTKLFGYKSRSITDLIGSGASQITMAEAPQEKVAERAILDARNCLEAWDYLGATGEIPKKALALETRVMPVGTEIQKRGMRVDKQAVSEHRQRLQKEWAYMKALCEGLWGFNPGSSNQLAASLEADGYKVMFKRGKDGKRRPKLDKKALKTYYMSVPKAVLTARYRSVQTLLTHLIRPLDEGRYMVGDRIHPNMNLNIAESGRISRSNPATQNINEALRNIIIPDEGNELLDWDFSQIELRWACYLWEDLVMQDVFKHDPSDPRGDVHQRTCDLLIAQGLGQILGPTPELRRWVAKQVNFTVLFGGDEYVLFERYQIPTTIGSRLVPAFWQAYPGLLAGIKETERFALDNGYTETFLGRRRDETEKLESNNEYTRTKALRELVNHRIQGSAAETMKEALWNDRQAPQIHTVHDQAIQDVKPGTDYMGYLNKPAPFWTPVEVKRGQNWRDVR